MATGASFGFYAITDKGNKPIVSNNYFYAPGEQTSISFLNKDILTMVKHLLSSSGANKLIGLGITLNKLTNPLDFTPTPKVIVKYNPVPSPDPFKLVSTSRDYDNNRYKFIFNKEFTINPADIEFKDSKGNAMAFTHSIVGQELIITPIGELSTGTYTITVKKVTSTDNDVLTNLPPLTLLIQSSFYLTGKDFSDFIPLDLTELNLSFNKNFTVTSISIEGTTVTSSINEKVLKISLSSLAEDTIYPLTIKVKSVDNEILELVYSLNTRSITGNKDLDRLLYPILRMFEDGRTRGIIIIISAVGIGTIFVSAGWLWGLAKGWLKTV